MKLFSWHLQTALLFGVIAAVSIIVWASIPSKDTTIEICVAQQGSRLPDGFYVWHHLDAHGIRFKSITPKNNNLLITFASSAQSEAAKEVLHRALPSGYVFDQQESHSQSTSSWLSLLRSNHSHV